MTIRKLTRRTLLGGAATALVISVSAAAALAATTFTVKPGGSITGKAGTTTLTDTKSGTVLTCTSSTAKGTVKSGSGLSGTGIGSITSQTFSNCTGPIGITFKVSTSHFPWQLNAVSYKKGVSTGTITGIHATLTGPSCKATVDGTGATKDNGQVAVTYTNSNGHLAVLKTGGNLHVYNVKGCAGLIKSNDPTTFVGTFTLSPKQTITSP